MDQPVMDINWERLAQIPELQEYFEADYEGFKQRVQQRIQEMQQIAPEELDKMALIRALEVPNGIVQWAFRRQDDHCLSVEQTRECMQVVVGFIREQKIALPSGNTIEFAPETSAVLDEVRDIYQDAFKNNVPGAEQEYHAHSAAQFMVFGRRRMQAAIDQVQQQFEPLFSEYYLKRGERYIAKYMEAAPE